MSSAISDESRFPISGAAREDVADGLTADKITIPSAVSRELVPLISSAATEANDGAASEHLLARWLQAAMAGDGKAYGSFLGSVTPCIRAVATRLCERFGVPMTDAEAIVQDVLLAIHLKRATWDPSRPIGPWISAIFRKKSLDFLRRRGHEIRIPIENYFDKLAVEDRITPSGNHGLERTVARLEVVQRKIVLSLFVDGSSVHQTAARLGMTEAGVRVALHRAIKSIAALCRNG